MEFYVGYALGAALANMIWIYNMAHKISQTTKNKYYFHIRSHTNFKMANCEFCNGVNTWIPGEQGFKGNSEAHRRIGKLGGAATVKSRGKEFLRTIGSKGGKVSGGNFKFDKQRAREMGRIGGLNKGHKAYKRSTGWERKAAV